MRDKTFIIKQNTSKVDKLTRSSALSRTIVSHCFFLLVIVFSFLLQLTFIIS